MEAIDVELTSRGDGRLDVRVSGVGSPSLDVPREAVVAIRSALNRGLQSYQAGERGQPTDRADFKHGPALGVLLAAAVESRARRFRRGAIRLRVILDPTLWHLPLEYVFLEGQPVALRDDVSLVRVVDGAAVHGVGATEPIRIVVGLAATPPGYEPLDLTEDRKAFVRAVEEAKVEQPINVMVDESATWEGLRARLAVGADVVWIAAHGDGDSIVFEDQPVTGNELAAELVVRGVRLAVLATCGSAIDDRAGEVPVRALAAAGIPYTVGMSGPVTDRNMAAFLRAFLRTVFSGSTIDDAVREGRQSLHNRFSLQWGLPMLVLPLTGDATDDGVLAPAVRARAERRRPEGRLPFRLPRFDSARSFVGRTDELLRLRDQIEVSGSRRVVIHAPAGTGKSQLANQACLLASRNPEGAPLVWWISADSEQRIRNDLTDLANEVGMESPDAPRAVLDWLTHDVSPHVIVFDNAPNRGTISWALPTGGEGAVIVTTRDPTGWEDFDVKVGLEPFTRQDSIDLLLRMTGSDDRAGAGALAEEMGDLPLALVQAGARIESTGISFGEYLERVRLQPVELLGHEAPRGHPDSLVAALRDTLDETSPTARRLVEVLYHLDPDGVPRDVVMGDAALERLRLQWNEAADVIAHLRRLALVTTQVGYGALRFHRLTAQLVTLLLATPRYGDDPRFPEGDDPHAVACDLVANAWPQPGDGLTDRIRILDLLPSAERLLDRATDEPTHVEARLMTYVATALRERGDSARAWHLLDTAVCRFDALGDVDSWAESMGQRALAESSRHVDGMPLNERKALAAATLDAVLDRLGPDVPQRAIALGRRAEIGSGLSKEARRRMLVEAEERTRAGEIPVASRCAILGRLAVVLQELGKLREALSVATQRLELAASELPGGRQHTLAHRRMAMILRRNGDFESARRHAEEAIDLDLELERLASERHPTVAAQQLRSLGTSYNNLSVLLTTMGAAPEALAAAKRSVDYFDCTPGLSEGVLGTRIATMGTALLANSRFDDAVAAYQESARLAASVDSSRTAFRLASAAWAMVLAGRPLSEIVECENSAWSDFGRGRNYSRYMTVTLHAMVGVVARTMELDDANGLVASAMVERLETRPDGHPDVVRLELIAAVMRGAGGDDNGMTTTLADARTALVGTGLPARHWLFNHLDLIPEVVARLRAERPPQGA